MASNIKNLEKITRFEKMTFAALSCWVKICYCDADIMLHASSDVTDK